MDILVLILIALAFFGGLYLVFHGPRRIGWKPGRHYKDFRGWDSPLDYHRNRAAFGHTLPRRYQIKEVKT